ncbi:unnamed protein product [Linum trigynum]|uniref:Uncharacterized protein n=1 Tax=Linum trigynum TaxID=586398 RepID=A0AAV2FAD4_9ROSI
MRREIEGEGSKGEAESRWLDATGERQRVDAGERERVDAGERQQQWEKVTAGENGDLTDRNGKRAAAAADDDGDR